MLDYFEEAFAARRGKLAALPRPQPPSLETPFQRESLQASSTSPLLACWGGQKGATS
jgi:hypothetical protein